MFEFPRTMDSNASCNLCAACIKTCPNDALQITLRPPTKELWFVRRPRFAEAFLAIVIMGIVFVQNVTMLEIWNSLLAQLQQITRTDIYAVNFTITFVLAMALPVALFSLAAVAARRFNGESVAANLTRFGYAIIPLDIAGHIAHNLYHLLAEGKAIAFTAWEMFGWQTDATSAALMPLPAIQVMQYGLIALGALASLYAVYAIGKNHYGRAKHRGALLSYAALIVVFFGINIWLFALPMAMRM